MLGRLELSAEVSFGQTGQVLQQCWNSHSELTGNPGLNVIFFRVEDLIAEAERVSVQRIEDAANEFCRAIENYLTHARGHLLVVVCPSAPIRCTKDVFYAISEAEQLVSSFVTECNGAAVINSSRLLQLYSISRWYDELSDRQGLMPYSPEMYTVLATVVARQLHALTFCEKYKVVVADCDNTLWTGIVAEDGPTGVTIDSGRKALQWALSEQCSLGRLLCLSSRNNEADVWQVFEHNPEMLISRDQIIASRINWKPKHESLTEISSELGLPLDSFVFLDDDPVVCAEIRSTLPEVLVIQVPAQSEQLQSFVHHVWAFDKPKVTPEDRQRVDYYRRDRMTRELRAQCSSYEEFLQGLGVRVTLTKMVQADALRISQLLHRTNQFNSNRMPLSESELLAYVASSDRGCLVVRASDRFGDHGLAGCLLFSIIDSELVVETLAVSCRVLGRNVEMRILEELNSFAASLSCTRILFRFVSTQRNKPAKIFLDAVAEGMMQCGNTWAYERKVVERIEEVWSPRTMLMNS